MWPLRFDINRYVSADSLELGEYAQAVEDGRAAAPPDADLEMLYLKKGELSFLACFYAAVFASKISSRHMFGWLKHLLQASSSLGAEISVLKLACVSRGLRAEEIDELQRLAVRAPIDESEKYFSKIRKFNFI